MCAQYTPGGYIVKMKMEGIIMVLIIRILFNTMSPIRSGIALAVTLVVAFVLCAIAQAVLPGPQFSHMWLSLFTSAPMGSLQAWIEGLIASVVVGFILGYCFAHCYNWSGKHA